MRAMRWDVIISVIAWDKGERAYAIPRIPDSNNPIIHTKLMTKPIRTWISIIHFFRDCAIAHNPSDPIPRGMLVKFVKFCIAVIIVISTMSRSL